LKKELGLMKSDISELVKITESQIEPAAETLARAFHNYPVFTYVFPDESERRKEFPILLQSFIHFGVMNGEVYATSPEMEGITVWMPPGFSGGYSIPPEVSKDALDRMNYYGKKVYKVRKRYVPYDHWFLEFIGVTPEYQGKGFAGNLLTPMLDRIKEENLHCYLDTELAKNVDLYKHFGFDVVEDSMVADTGVYSWGMLMKDGTVADTDTH